MIRYKRTITEANNSQINITFTYCVHAVFCRHFISSGEITHIHWAKTGPEYSIHGRLHIRSCRWVARQLCGMTHKHGLCYAHTYESYPSDPRITILETKIASRSRVWAPCSYAYRRDAMHGARSSARE